MVVKKICEALPWLRRYSNTVSFATLTPFCAHIFQGLNEAEVIKDM